MSIYQNLSNINTIKYKEEYSKGKRKNRKMELVKKNNWKIKGIKSDKKEINESNKEKKIFNKSLKNDTFINYNIDKNINAKSLQKIKFSKDRSDINCYQNYEATEDKIFPKNKNNNKNDFKIKRDKFFI